MHIAVGSDHRGFHLKERVIRVLQGMGHQVTDMGTDGSESVDYPDYAGQVAQYVSNGSAERGILICGTGIGMAITANKFAGVRAATCSDEAIAEVCRRHNDVNVLCLPGDVLDNLPVDGLLKTWIETPFDGGRHERRLIKIRDIECTERPGNC